MTTLVAAQRSTHPLGGWWVGGAPGTIVGVSQFDVVVGAGTLQAGGAEVVHFPHQWTARGVSVNAVFTGAHLLHLAVAGCVLNDVFREAKGLGLSVRGVRVTASGDFDTRVWESTGVSYAVTIDSPSSPHEVEELLAAVDAVAEIPMAIRAGADVVRVPDEARTPVRR